MKITGMVFMSSNGIASGEFERLRVELEDLGIPNIEIYTTGFSEGRYSIDEDSPFREIYETLDDVVSSTAHKVAHIDRNKDLSERKKKSSIRTLTKMMIRNYETAVGEIRELSDLYATQLDEFGLDLAEMSAENAGHLRENYDYQFGLAGGRYRKLLSEQVEDLEDLFDTLISARRLDGWEYIFSRQLDPDEAEKAGQHIENAMKLNDRWPCC